MNNFSLNNEVAVITGGGTGLGLAMAREFVAAGARVVLVGRRVEPLKAACAELGAAATFRPHDVADFAAAPALLADVERTIGPVSILINNAGVHLKKPMAEVTENEIGYQMDIHVLGAHALSRAAYALMKPRGKGSIVFIASMASLFGLPMVGAYAVAKSALLGLMRTMAVEWSAYGVRVNAIAPGWIETDITRSAVLGDPARLQRIIQRTPMGRMGQPDDVAGAAVFLCAPAAKFITGVVLPVDGGVSMGF
jgi:gluconate 5-dehydrogenase